MSREIKIGILFVVTAALAFWGFKFILGRNILRPSNTYKVVYPHVDGLMVGTQVRISGVQVGGVSGMELQDDQSVLVSINLNKGIQVPKNTKVVIKSSSIMGGKIIELVYDKPCKDGDCAESGQFLEGISLGAIQSMVTPDELKTYVDVVKIGLQGVIDTLNKQLLSDDSDSPLANSVRSLESTLISLESATGQVDGLLASSSKNINSALRDVASLTNTLDSKKEVLGQTLDNANAISKQVADMDLAATVKSANDAILDLRTALAKVSSSLAGIDGVVNQVSTGNGSLSKLLQDDGLYYRIDRLSKTADSLLIDIEEAPYRYIPLKSRRKVLRYDKQDGRE